MSPSYREHVMLLYNSDDERNVAAAIYFNEGLASGQLCVHAPVGAHASASMWDASRISPNITGYEENVKSGNLIIVDFKPFFEYAQKGDLIPFTQLKVDLERMLGQRIEAGKEETMQVFADAACTLSEKGEFDECVTPESWWQRAHKEWMESRRNIRVICPHAGSVLDKNTKDRIGTVHSVTLHLHHYILN